MRTRVLVTLAAVALICGCGDGNPLPLPQPTRDAPAQDLAGSRADLATSPAVPDGGLSCVIMEDCPPGMACNLVDHTCRTTCDELNRTTTWCRGTCCCRGAPVSHCARSTEQGGWCCGFAGLCRNCSQMGLSCNQLTHACD